MFNEASCAAPGPLAYDYYDPTGENLIRSQAVVGTCLGLLAGSYTIQVRVGDTPGYGGGDAYTGWNSYWSLEAEEVRSAN